MWKRLSDEAIKTRLIRLHNLEKMYANQVKANGKLKKKIKRLEKENAILRKENQELREKVQRLELMVEELQRMVFWKTSKPWNDKTSKERTPTQQKQRSKESYRRPAPSEDVVTECVEHAVSWCKHCWWELEKRTYTTRYLEDMILPQEEETPYKETIQEEIEKWYCVMCKKRTSAKYIQPQICTLWNNVRKFVVYGITVLHLSYSQLKNYLETVARISISDGEIVNILMKESAQKRGEYENMKERIRAWPFVHYDETSWRVQSLSEGNYARVMWDAKWEERIYLLWANRWKWNAEYLQWEYELVRVTDDYPAYHNMNWAHQLCWAHPIRKLRDLSVSRKLNKLDLELCKLTYEQFRTLHADLLSCCDMKKWEQRARVETRLLWHFDDVVKTRKWDPKKLITIKQTLQKRKEKYFTCLYVDWLPTTNNSAERALRPLVIKKKQCFGSKTSQWATMMEVLYSVVYSLFARWTTDFFSDYAQL